MPVLEIARMGEPVLERVADEVIDAQDPVIQKLLADMEETMREVGGIGLAAPQVFQPLRIVLFEVPEARGGVAVPLTRLINPVIEPLSEEREEGPEACLSVPGMMGMVERYTRIRYTGLDESGRPIDREAEGFHARVVQHECDHLDGTLYPRRMKNLSKFGFASEMTRRLGLAPKGEESQDSR
ncbi:MAG: peptide deformylase [Magnetovibrionaceae bacterium]